MPEITEILQCIEKEGGGQRAEQLLPLIYEELRKVAASKLAREAPGQTLQTTALVHEAWLRVAGDNAQQWQGRRHFFAAAAEAMRRILIEQARRKQAARHGGGQQRVELAEEIAAPDSDDQLLALHEALNRLAEHDAAKAEVVKLHYFVGLTLKEAAEVLDISEPTAKRYWAYARAWLYREMKRG